MVINPIVNHIEWPTTVTSLQAFNVRFKKILQHAFLYTLFVGLSLLVGLLLAVLIDQLVWGETFFRTVFLYPVPFLVVWYHLAVAPAARRYQCPSYFGGCPP